MAFKLAEAFVELNTRGFSGVSSTLSKTAGQMSRMAKIGGAVLVGGVTAAGTALFAMGTKAAAAGDKIHKMAARTGASAEFLSEMGFAAGQSGSDIDTLADTLKDMGKNVSDASRGAGGATESLNMLGLSAEQLMTLNTEERFLAIADRLASVSDTAQRSALAMTIFGESGHKLLPLINQGSAGIAKMRAEAAGLGATMTTDGVNSAAAYTDAVNRFQTALGGVSQRIGTAVLPAMTEMVDAATPIINTFGTYLSDAVMMGVDAVRFAMEQGGTLVAIWAEQTRLAIENLPARFVAFGTNIVEIAQWAFDNWYDIAMTAADAVLTVFINIGENIRMVWKEVVDYILSGGTDQMEFAFTPLLDGFRSSISEMPELTKAAINETSPLLEALRDQYDQNNLKLFGDPQTAATTTPQRTAAEDMRQVPTQSEESRSATAFASLADFSKQLNQTDQTPKKQLNVLEEIRDAIQEGGDTVPVVG